MITVKNPKALKKKSTGGQLTKSGRIYKNNLLTIDYTAGYAPTRRMI
jgi:hypothetical protein